MRSLEYPKTENLLARDPETHKLIPGEYRRPEFDMIKRWHVTEKLDGTNMRVVYDPFGSRVEIRGRSDRASIAGDLRASMEATFTPDALARAFDEFIGPERIDAGTTVTLFGEGIGPGIQRNPLGLEEKTFRLFDVMYHWPICPAEDAYHNSWCRPSTVEMIAGMLGVPTAPVIDRGMELSDIWDFVSRGVSSRAAVEAGGVDVLAEGVIARTDPYLFNERGQRIMFKLKGEDIA